VLRIPGMADDCKSTTTGDTDLDLGASVERLKQI
jgi:hypothetical protein